MIDKQFKKEAFKQSVKDKCKSSFTEKHWRKLHRSRFFRQSVTQ